MTNPAPNFNFKGQDFTFRNSSKTANHSVWADVIAHFKLDHRSEDARVKKEIHKLLADREGLNKALKAARNYIHYILVETHMHGLPGEIALIPFIESEFNPNDHSKAGALGLWQLMPATARGFGVKNNEGRRDLVASTQAALHYFQDLGKLFHGDWYLAIAAYNCGECRILSAKKHAGSDNYWDLKLPLETTLYVPKLLAIAEIIKNPGKYGVELPAIDAF